VCVLPPSLPPPSCSRLNFCGLSDLGACLLAKALTLNAALRRLAVQNNAFQSKGAESLVGEGGGGGCMCVLACLSC
jgi:hypothetical protein